MHVHSDVIGISPKLEITQMSFHGYVIKQTIHLCNEILLISTNEEFHLGYIHEIITEMKNRLVVAKGRDERDG